LQQFWASTYKLAPSSCSHAASEDKFTALLVEKFKKFHNKSHATSTGTISLHSHSTETLIDANQQLFVLASSWLLDAHQGLFPACPCASMLQVVLTP
jgi:hypothetical protein